jgi:inosine-uridine nucleoside N-ribohydrolase
VLDSTWPASLSVPRLRVLVDNDFSGDPDGLVQLAQHVLSPSVDIRTIIGSHLAAGDWWDPVDDTADRAAAEARRVLELAARTDIPVVAGSNVALGEDGQPIQTEGTDAIIAEAMRDDTDLPLFLTCGAGLTEVASAWLLEPRIAERLTVVWIGGHEHQGLAERPPGGSTVEYNLNIDLRAGQIVFNESDLSIWQIPRNMYRTAIASRAEMLLRMRAHGPLGEHIFDALARDGRRALDAGQRIGETWVLGDSPLVLLTALMTHFQAAPASSTYVTMPCPRIDDEGQYLPSADGRPLRVYTSLDTRLMLEDLYAKLELHASS